MVTETKLKVTEVPLLKLSIFYAHEHFLIKDSERFHSFNAHVASVTVQ